MDMTGFLRQRCISATNVAQLQRFCDSPDDEVRETAALVLEVARTKPGRRKRVAHLAGHKPDLLLQLVQRGLLPNWEHEPDDVSGAGATAWTKSIDSELPF
jgi:hypothetical protein